MTHDPHDHGHDPDHHHDHGHDHHHDHGHDHDDGASEPGFEEKMTTLIRHWIAHNDSHGRNYQAWAGKAQSHNLEDVARFLKEAGNLSDRITRALENALKKLTQ